MSRFPRRLKLQTLPGSPFGRRLAARSLMSRLDHWAAAQFYTVRELADRSGELYDAIYADFNGSNYSEVATKYGVTRYFVYRAIKAARSRHSTPT